MKYRATVTNLWLDVPKGPPQPGHHAAITADIRGKRADQVRVEFDPEEAAALGRRLLDWASQADIVTAVDAVGTVMRERAHGR